MSEGHCGGTWLEHLHYDLWRQEGTVLYYQMLYHHNAD